MGGRAERALGHGPLVGVEHDADRRALAGGAGGRGAGGGGGQQLGLQRVLLAQGLVRHDRDLAVPRRADQGDDAAALEEPQDAPARLLDELLDVRLGGRGCRVEHLPLPVAVGGVDTVEEQGLTRFGGHPRSAKSA